MLLTPYIVQFNPVFFSIGPLTLRWYGLMYLLGFWFAIGRSKHYVAQSNSGWRSDEIKHLLYSAFWGLFLGGRIGYVLFYQLQLFFSDPLSLLRIWEGGMSFHGGLIGVIIVMIRFANASQRHFLRVADVMAPLVPVGLGLGRLGNFINGELWGRVTDVPWAMIFPQADLSPRHPSQLYEAFLEGVVLFIVLKSVAAKPRPMGMLSGLFLFLYGLFRFVVEYFREPDAHCIYLIPSITMGQLLSLPMIIAGSVLLIQARRSKLHTVRSTCNPT